MKEKDKRSENMPRFLVGATEDTWDFDAAYEAAEDGDIIEFTPHLTMNFTKEPFTEITKNITIVSHVEGKRDFSKLVDVSIKKYQYVSHYRRIGSYF